MNWQWPVSCLLVGAGIATAYWAGMKDAAKEIERHQTEVWHSANHTNMGTLDDADSKRDRDHTASDPA